MFEEAAAEKARHLEREAGGADPSAGSEELLRGAGGRELRSHSRVCYFGCAKGVSKSVRVLLRLVV